MCKVHSDVIKLAWEFVIQTYIKSLLPFHMQQERQPSNMQVIRKNNVQRQQAISCGHASIFDPTET